MLAEFANIIDCPSFKAFSLPLKPLTLGHLFLLESIASPILIAPDTIELADILLAVWICSQSWAAARDSLKDKALAELVFEWGKEWGRNKPESVESETKQFGNYLSHYMKSPPRWETGEANGKSKTPWQLFLITSLQKELGISEIDAWNLEVNKAYTYFATISEAYYGDESLVAEDEVEQADKMKERVRKLRHA